MVDSGNQYSSGAVDYFTVYRGMVNASLLRPAQAELEAYAWRTGNKVGFYARVQNLTDDTLSWSNSATVHGIVYEDIHLADTDRYVRAAVSTSIASLAPGGTGTFTMQTNDLVDVNWDKLHFIVLVDYVPPESAGAYDMLQAVEASMIATPFDVHPSTLSLCIDPANPTNPSMTLHIMGADFLEWTVQEEISWLDISPLNGSIATQPVITIDSTLLLPGAQQGMLAFTTVDGFFTHNVQVNAFYGICLPSYLPMVNR